MKIKTIIIVMGMLLPMLSVKAQQIKPLQIGDTVPDYHWDSTFNYNNRALNLHDFKGKFLLLDFWASWCGSCIEHFPIVDSLQKTFPKELAVLLINPKKSMDGRERVARAMNRYQIRYNRSLTLPVVYDDTAAFKDAHIRLLPHYIWIGKDGVIKAITNSVYLTEENIRDFLSGKTLEWIVKDDFAK